MTCEDSVKTSLDNNSLIFLVGFMGAGKSTVGRVLAERLSCEFIDLDDVVEAQTGLSVQAIFAESGEAEFRRLEREAIESCRKIKRACVALGGGAYVSEENRAILRRLGKTVWLDCPLKICLTRIASDRSRPLLGGEGEMKALFDSRRPHYTLADYRVETGVLPAKYVAQAIIDLLGI
ncbi:MAG: shikimate kinase [Blastocatellia bacterium]|nr:shikimate kinase [Blastocatellia bacterium]